jgi:hypothetical protein
MVPFGHVLASDESENACKQLDERLGLRVPQVCAASTDGIAASTDSTGDSVVFPMRAHALLDVPCGERRQRRMLGDAELQ